MSGYKTEGQNFIPSCSSIQPWGILKGSGSVLLLFSTSFGTPLLNCFLLRAVFTSWTEFSAAEKTGAISSYTSVSQFVELEKVIMTIDIFYFFLTFLGVHPPFLKTCIQFLIFYKYTYYTYS